MTTELLERNHKGEWCPDKPVLLCQEGYYSDCSNQRKLVIYISAPYSLGDTAENIRNACLAANEILRKGHIPFIPQLSHLWHLITPKSKQEWLEIDLALIPRMDGLLRLPGISQGADNEVKLAKELGIKVYYSLNEIKESI